MNKETYHTPRTDKQRIFDLQRHIMKLEERISQLQILDNVSFEDDGRIVPEYKQREQTPMYMIQTLKECHDVIDDSTESGEGLKKDLRRVIEFLKQ